MSWSMTCRLGLVLGIAVVSLQTASAESFLSPDAKVRTFKFHQHGKLLNLAGAVAMRLPRVAGPLPSLVELTIEGAKAQGAEAATPASATSQTNSTVTSGSPPPPEYGSSKLPYTMARTPGAQLFPYRAAGVLGYDSGGGNLVTCSAALLKPGIVVTAAHCIVPFGSMNQYSGFFFLPGWSAAGPPFGVWNVASASVLACWTAGTDTCATPGVICQDDIGVLTLMPDSQGKYAGATTGVFNYSTTNYSYSQGQVEITQLGYSSGYDSAGQMLRNDAQGYVGSPTRYSRNTIIGSPLGDGSDGGPWVVNLGPRPLITTTTWSYGAAYTHNVIVGVTSWSSGTSSAQKIAGASPFRADNIGTLVTNACNATPAAC